MAENVALEGLCHGPPFKTVREEGLRTIKHHQLVGRGCLVLVYK